MNLADRSRRRRRGPRNEASDIRRVPSAQVSEEVLSLGSPFLLRDDSERDASKAGTLTPRRGQPMPDAHTLRDRSHSLNDGFSRSMSTQREPSNHAYTTASQTPNRQYNPLDPDRTVRRQNGSTSLPSPSMNPQSADSPDNLHSRASMLTRIKRVTSNVANVFFSPSSTPVPRHRTVSKNFDVFHGRALSSRDRIFDSNSTTFTSSSASSTSAFVSSSSESDMSLSNYSAWEKASDRNNGTSQHDSRARTGSLPPAIAGGHIFRNYASTIHRQVDDALFTPPSSPELHYSTNRMPSSLQSLSSESEFPYLELSHFRSNSGFDDRYADSRVFEANYEEDGHRSDVFLVAQESHSIAQTNLESQLDTNYDFDPDQTIQLPRSETLADLGNVLDEYRYRDYEMQDGDHTPSYEYGEDLLLMPMGPEFDKNDSGDGDGLVEDGDEMLFDPNGSVPDLWRASSEENISVIMRSGLRTGAARRDRNGAGISGTSTPSENSVLKRRRQSGVGDGGAVTFGNGTEYDMKLADDDAERYLAPAFQGNSSSYHSNSALGADGRDDDAMTVSWAAPAVELFHDHEEYDDMPLLQPDAFYREFNSAENKEELVAARSREDKGKGVDLSYMLADEEPLSSLETVPPNDDEPEGVLEDDAGWENVSAALEESRIAQRNATMGWEPSLGENSRSYTAFLWLHASYYDYSYHEYLFQKWTEWHQHLEREAHRSKRRASRAALSLDRTMAIKLMRPRIRRRRAFSELGLSTVDGFHHSIQTPHASHFPAIAIVRPLSAAF